jgi:hypothetical protein
MADRGAPKSSRKDNKPKLRLTFKFFSYFSTDIRISKRMWEEVTIAKTENRRELVLAGKAVADRVDKSGLGKYP